MSSEEKASKDKWQNVEIFECNCLEIIFMKTGIQIKSYNTEYKTSNDNYKQRHKIYYNIIYNTILSKIVYYLFSHMIQVTCHDKMLQGRK